MTISFTRYIDITSVVGATDQLPARSLSGRIFTDNNLVPPQSFITITNPADALTYFGSSSAPEYLRAVYYFSFVNKDGVSPTQMDFARWVDVAVAPMIFGNVQSQLLSTYTAITNGSFTLTIGAETSVLTGLNFSAAASLADVAEIIEDAVQASQIDVQWTAATVTFDPVRGSFNFVGGSAVTAVISVTEGIVGTPIAGLIGWLTGAVLCNGSAVETITQALTTSYAASNNFGSFIFMPTFNVGQMTEAATWAYGTKNNVAYFPRVTAANAAAARTALMGIGANAAVLAPLSSEYPEQFPMMIIAATDYSQTNAVQNFMYQQSNLTASVSSDADANTYDGLFTNYYGLTQDNGTQIAFFQRGEMNGPATSPSTISVFANEMWMKAAITTQQFNLLLAVNEIAANAQGQTLVSGAIQTVVNQAVVNGTISVGKTLTPTQRFYITSITGDPQAWHQVQDVGYWLNVEIVPVGPSEFKAVYTLVYSKNDVVNKVEGTDLMI